VRGLRRLLPGQTVPSYRHAASRRPARSRSACWPSTSSCPARAA